MNNAFYTYGNKDLITQKSFSVIPAKAKPVLQPLLFSLVENMLGVRELRNHLHHFEKICNPQEDGTLIAIMTSSGYRKKDILPVEPVTDTEQS